MEQKKRSKSKAILAYFWHSIALSSGSKFHCFGYDLSTLFKLGGNESKGMCTCTPMSKPCSVCGSLSFSSPSILPFGHFATFWDNLSLFDSHFLVQRMFDSHFLDSMSVNVSPSQQVLSFSSIKLSNNEVNMDGELTEICTLVLMTFDIAYKYRIKWSCLPFYCHRCRR